MRRVATALSLGCAVALFASLSGAGSVVGAAGASPASGGFSADSPLKIVGFWEVQGESSVGTSDFENAAVMAIDDLNEKGGVGGEDVEYERVANPVLDPQKAVAQYLKTLDADPTVVLGGAGSTETISAQVARSGVALITPDVSANLEFGAPSGSEYMWQFSGEQRLQWQEAERYLVDDLGAERLAFIGYTIPFGSIARQAVKKEAKKLGVEIVADEKLDVQSRDLTQQVIAMKDADAQAVLNASYPNDITLQLRQSQQNGFDVPSMLPGGATQAVAADAIPGDLLTNAYAIADCNTFSDNPGMVAFREAYLQEYDREPSYLSAKTWDMIHYAAAIANKAKSTDPEDFNAAISSTTYKRGICDDDLHADGAHVMMHTSFILKFAPDGTWTEVKTYDERDHKKVND